MKTQRLCFDLDATDTERLPHIIKLYDLAMSQPIPDSFPEMLQWANAREAARTEFARFLRKILDQGGVTDAAPTEINQKLLSGLKYMVRFFDQLTPKDAQDAQMIIDQAEGF